MKTAAIILAAGFSSRMGQDKASLLFGDMTALELLLATYQQAGVRQAVVVSGKNQGLLQQRGLAAKLVQNSDPAAGMFSSVRLGAAQLDADVDAFFVQPVDIPLVRAQTLLALQQALLQTPAAQVLVPCCAAKRGHPPLLRRELIVTILAEAGNESLRGVLSQFLSQELQVDDQGVLLGMNTPQQYQALLRYWQGQVLATRGGYDALSRA